MKPYITSCGIDCNDCELFHNDCEGCYEVAGKTFWAIDHMPEKICPLYECAVNKRSLKSCGECSELPCTKFNDLKDPSISDEEHQISLKNRLERLRGNAN